MFQRTCLPGAFAAVAFAAALAGTAPARAAASYDACTGFIDSLPAVLTTKGVWCLRGDLSIGQTTGQAILVDANNITVDCNGFRLGGLAAGVETSMLGIDGNGRLNVAVRGCNIRGFLVGVRLLANAAGEGGHLVEDNRFDGNTYMSIYVVGDGSVVRRNLVRETGGTTFSAAAFGIRTLGVAYLVDNIVAGVSPGDGGSTAYGLYIDGNDGGAARRNVVTSVFSASAVPVVSLGGTRLWFDGNRVAGLNIMGSTGIGCTAPTIRLSNNSVSGFGVGENGCSRPVVDNNDIP